MVIPGSRNIRVDRSLQTFQMCQSCHPSPYYPEGEAPSAPALPHLVGSIAVLDRGYNPEWPAVESLRWYVTGVAVDSAAGLVTMTGAMFAAGKGGIREFLYNPHCSYECSPPGLELRVEYENQNPPFNRGEFSEPVPSSYTWVTTVWTTEGLPSGDYQVTLTPSLAGAYPGPPFVFRMAVKSRVTVDVLRDNSAVTSEWSSFSELDLHHVDGSHPNRLTKIRFQFPEHGHTVQVIIDNLGSQERVYEGPETNVDAGIYAYREWDGFFLRPTVPGGPVSPGLYGVRISANGGPPQGMPEVLVLGPDPLRSSLDADKRFLVPDGADTATLTATLVDGLDQPLHGWTVRYMVTKEGTQPEWLEGPTASGNAYSAPFRSTEFGDYTIDAYARSPDSDWFPVGVEEVKVVRYMGLEGWDEDLRLARNGLLEIVPPGPLGETVTARAYFDPEHAPVSPRWRVTYDGFETHHDGREVSLPLSHWEEWLWLPGKPPREYYVETINDGFRVRLYNGRKQTYTIGTEGLQKFLDGARKLNELADKLGSPLSFESAARAEFGFWNQWAEAPESNEVRLTWGVDGRAYVSVNTSFSVSLLGAPSALVSAILDAKAGFAIEGEMGFEARATVGVEGLGPLECGGFGQLMGELFAEVDGASGLMKVSIGGKTKLVGLDALVEVNPEPPQVFSDTTLTAGGLTVYYQVEFVNGAYRYTDEWQVWEEAKLWEGRVQVVPWEGAR
jgi:hypothetical protein